MKRNFAVDNLRYGVVLSVVLYHVFYMFNSVGVVSTIGVQGIPQADIVEYVLYPWFMAILFLLAGVSARYSLSHRTGKEFWHQRVQTILVPAVGGFFLTDWITAIILCQYIEPFGAAIPAPFKYLICCLMGIGPLWFLHVVILASALLLLVRKLDKNDRLFALGAKAANPVVLLLGFFPYWGMAQILNVKLMPMYRFGLYLYLFLLGYCVFSHPEVLEVLKKWHLPLLAGAIVSGAAFVWCFWGQNFSDLACLRQPLTNVYAWLTILALIGCAEAWWNKDFAFTRWMRPRSFAIFALHYPAMSVFAWLYATVLSLPAGLVYVLLIVTMAVVLPLLYEAISRIPGLRYWILGIRSKKEKAPADQAKL
jgi:glucan biosynthesis protein C